jgi:hypothetical protein
MSPTSNTPTPTVPTPVKIRRWRQYLADEKAEAAVYRELASRREGEERDILLGLADAEGGMKPTGWTCSATTPGSRSAAATGPGSWDF